MALADGRLTQAKNLIDAAPPNHPEATEVQLQLQQRVALAQEAYARYQTAFQTAGQDSEKLKGAVAVLQEAKGLWRDNPEYATAERQLQQLLRPRKPQRIRGREIDISDLSDRPTEGDKIATLDRPTAPGAPSTGDTTPAPGTGTDAQPAPSQVAIRAEPPKPWAPLPSTNPCTPRLAGHGKRAKAICFDIIGELGASSLNGPLMVVVPASEGISLFAISKYEISINDYNKYCLLSGECRRISGDKNRPITSISISEAERYTGWLSQRTGNAYRLPTSAEWEHAANAAGKQPKKDFNCRVTLGDKTLKGTDLISVKSGMSNGWGLKNYLGNAQEWVKDGDSVRARGGAYSDALSNCEVSLSREHGGIADEITGFRVVLVNVG